MHYVPWPKREIRQQQRCIEISILIVYVKTSCDARIRKMRETKMSKSSGHRIVADLINYH